MGCFSTRCLSFVSAILHLLGNILGAAASITCCVWYKNENRKQHNEEIGLTDTPYWIFVMLSISFSFAFLSSISLLVGIIRESCKMLGTFMTTMQWVVLFLLIRAFVVMSRHIKANHSAGSVFSDFCLDILYLIFIAITLIPIFMLYKELKGNNFTLCSLNCF